MPDKWDEPANSDLLDGKVYYGLSKRERFAMAAMQGLCADCEDFPTWTSLATAAMNCAEATLAELDRREQKRGGK